MKKKLVAIFKTTDKFLLWPGLLSLSISLLITIALLLLYSRLPSKLPLFYSLSWGESELVQKQQFFLLPVILLLVTLVNSLIISQLHPVQLVLKRTLMCSQVLTSLLIAITTLKILLIFI